MPSLRVTFVTVVVAGLLIVAGCGGASDTTQVRSAWESASRAAADGAGTAFCSQVTAQGRQLITSRTKLSCEDSIRLLASSLSAADKTAIRDARITKIDVSGDTATVLYVTNASLGRLGFTGRTDLTKTDGHWLISGV
jgi:hypothetical protein